MRSEPTQHPEGGVGVMGYGLWGMGNSGLEAPSTGHREGGMGYGGWGMGYGGWVMGDEKHENET